MDENLFGDIAVGIFVIYDEYMRRYRLTFLYIRSTIDRLNERLSVLEGNLHISESNAPYGKLAPCVVGRFASSVTWISRRLHKKRTLKAEIIFWKCDHAMKHA